VLRTRTAKLAVHPIHVWREPVARHKNHAFLDLCQHGVELCVSRSHAFDDLLAILRHDCSESEIVTIDIESLREREGPPAVDRVACARTKVARVRLDFWLAPLVTLPVWMAAIVPGASMIRDLLDVHVPLIHVKFRTASQSIEALRIAIVVMVFASCWPGHVHQIEVQIATARRPISFEININTERFPRKWRHVEIIRVAVIRGGAPHQVVPVVRSVLDGLPAIQGCGAWQIVCLHFTILIDQNLTCCCCRNSFALGDEGFAILQKRSFVRKRTSLQSRSAHLHERLVFQRHRACSIARAIDSLCKKYAAEG